MERQANEWLMRYLLHYNDQSYRCETVVLLWGLFDDEMYVEFDAQKFGPYRPVAGPAGLPI